MTVSAEVADDRERIEQIVNLPQATGQLAIAIRMALGGAAVADARIALQITAGAMTPDQVAAHVNKQSAR
jgi:hypothetical protein